jgi:hypothetical protein
VRANGLAMLRRGTVPTPTHQQQSICVVMCCCHGLLIGLSYTAHLARAIWGARWDGAGDRLDGAGHFVLVVRGPRWYGREEARSLGGRLRGSVHVFMVAIIGGNNNRLIHFGIGIQHVSDALCDSASSVFPVL